MTNRWGKKWNQWETLFSWAPKSLWLQPWNSKMLALWKKSYDKPRECIKKQRYHFANKGLNSYGFSSSHVQMWQLDHKESWAPKNWCFRTVVLEKSLESPLDIREIKPGNPKGNQTWVFIGRTNTEAEAPILWPPDVKNQLIEKDPDVWKDWGHEEKGATDSMDMSLSKLWEIIRTRKPGML